MEQDKPLYVQVAEAVGWTRCELLNIAGLAWSGRLPADTPLPPGSDFMRTFPYEIPRFDTDWGATGPLIERYHLAVVVFAPSLLPRPEEDKRARAWYPGSDDINDSIADAYGPTALIAVCNLILALARAGKLEPEK